MFDIHCHVLPGVDDGAKDIGDSIAMCRAAANEGIKTIIATPHYIDEESEVDSSKLMSHIFLINQELKSENINLTVIPGMEVYITPNLLNLYNEGKVISLNCKNYILMELPLYNSLPTCLDDVIFNLELQDIRPVIAHPERCSIIRNHPNIVYELIKKDCLIQVNSGSFEGLYGKDAQSTAYKLLDNNMVHVIASDSHSSQGRVSLLKNTYEMVAKKYDSLLAQDLFINNPFKIINGSVIHVSEPVRIKKKRFWIV